MNDDNSNPIVCAFHYSDAEEEQNVWIRWSENPFKILVGR